MNKNEKSKMKINRIIKTDGVCSNNLREAIVRHNKVVNLLNKNSITREEFADLLLVEFIKQYRNSTLDELVELTKKISENE